MTSRIFGYALNAAYLAIIFCATPWIVWAAIRQGKYQEGFGAKLLGLVPRRPSHGACIWLHAVSVGEVNLLATTIAELRRNGPDLEVVISTTTKTGYELARRKYSDYLVFYCPLDFTWAVKNAVRRINPSVLVLAELELWPNLITASKRYGAPVAIINGRVSDKSFRGYHRVRPLIAHVLRQIDVIAAQNDETAERFLELGARPETVRVSGSLKFDGAQTDRANVRTAELRRLAGIDESDVIFLAGSTQDPEERMALELFASLATEHPQLRLVLVPRHPQRFDDVATLLAKSGLSCTRRSQLTAAPRNATALEPKWNVLLVDTVGELGAWWGVANIGFVGGSFGNRGGQNMLEPAAYGVATCFGPNTWNFRDIVAQLLSAQAASVVQDAAELRAFVSNALEQPGRARELGQLAQQLVLSQQGATRRTVALLQDLLNQQRDQFLRHAA